MSPQTAVIVASTQTEVAQIQPGVSGSFEQLGPLQVMGPQVQL